MEVKRKMVMAVNHVKMEDEDIFDVEFWLAKTPSERLAEVFRLRKNHYNPFPLKMEKVVHWKKM